VESENPAPGASVILAAASKPVGVGRLDLTLAKEVIGYEPHDIWPEGLPFPIE
jgi:hypothetical protein